MSDIFYSADGQVQNVDLVEHMTSDQYYLDGSLKIAGSIISKSFLNESGEPIGLPKNVEVKGSLRVNDKTDLRNTKINGNLEVNGPVKVNGPVNVNNVLNVKAIKLGNLTLTNTDNSLRIQNANGYIDIGTKNKDWGHIHTDRPKFSFNKNLVGADTKGKNYTEYIKYSADGGIQVNNFDLTTRSDELIVKNRVTNKVNMTVHKDGSVSLVNKSEIPQSLQTTKTKTWWVKWTPKLGSISFIVGSTIALHFQIKDDQIVMYSNINRQWVNSVDVPLLLTLYPRPLDFTVTFNNGFIITIGDDIIRYSNFLNITDANSINIQSLPGIVATEFKPNNWKRLTKADISASITATITTANNKANEAARKLKEVARAAAAKAQEAVLKAREAAARSLKPKLISDVEQMNPLGWFDANNFNQITQKWASRDGRYTINTSNVVKSNSPFPTVFGGTNSSITNIPWPGRNRDYTFIHVAKYNGNTRGRIWTGIGGNWLSGFWNNSVAFFHEGWFDYNINASNSGRDWLLSVDMNNFVRVNRGTYQKNGPAFSPDGISVASGPFGNEKSDFAIAEFLIFNRKLSQAEYTKVEEYLAKKYGLLGSARDLTLSLVSTSVQEVARAATTKQFLRNNIANDVRAGNFNNIRNSDFIISNNLNFWKLRIEFTSNDYYNSWQSMVGNMYNPEVPGRGWGLWVNPQGIIHLSESASSVNLDNLGRLQNNLSYRLEVVFNNNRYTLTLTNLSNNTRTSQTINRSSPIITDRGFVTIGGAWRNVSSERFKGSINNILVSTDPSLSLSALASTAISNVGQAASAVSSWFRRR